eukprot:gene5388-9195_t
MESLHLARQQLRGLFRKQFILQFRQKKSLICLVSYPIIILSLSFLFSILSPLILNVDIFQKERLMITPKYDLLNQMKRVSNITSDTKSDNTTRLILPKTFFITLPPELKERVGNLSQHSISYGLLSNIDQVKVKYFGNVPFSNSQFNDTNELDNYLYAQIDFERKNLIISLEMAQLIGAYDIKSFTDTNLKYTITHDADCGSCFNHHFRTLDSPDDPNRQSTLDSKQAKQLIQTALMSILNNAYLKSKNIPGVEASINQMPTWTFGIPALSQLKQVMISGFLTIPVLLLLPLPVFLYTIVLEKTENIREMMKLMGLKMQYYWIVFFTFNYLIYLFIAISTFLLCLAFQFKFALYGNPLITLLILFIWGFTLISYSIFLSSISRSVLVALILGYFIALFEPILGVYLSLRYFPGSNILNYLLTLWILPFPLHSALESGIILPCEKGNCPSIFSLFEINSITMGIFFMIFDSILYLIIGFYFDDTLPKTWGLKKGYFYCLKPIYKPFLKLISNMRKTNDELLIKEECYKDDSDVEEEREKILSGELSNSMVIIDRLNKYYGSFKAVNNLSFSIQKGEVFCLLGPNGAGKTTTLSILSGLFSASSGNAKIDNHDINTDMDKIRLFLGLCPQKDIQWNDLTVSEHLYFYARLRGIPIGNEKTNVDNVLNLVSLQDHQNKLSSELSGGMKRRLSIAMSLVGNPKVILLDEPTTGLDPTSKREIWDIISNIKENNCIILTTHSLEEADILSDRIGIMSHGNLMCLGDSTHLKKKFGEGYRLSISYDIKNENEIFKFINELIPDSKLINQFYGISVFNIPNENSKISFLFSEIEKKKREKNVIKNWGLSQTSLEDVFLEVIKRDESVDE